RLRLADRLCDVDRHRAGLRVRHQPARAEDAAELADVAHLVRRGDRDVEVGEAFLDSLREVGRADDVCAGVLRLLRLLALGEHGDALLATGAVREHQRAAQLLLGVPDVEAEVHVHLDRLVELRRVCLLEDPDRLGGRVNRLAVDRATDLPVSLAVRCHYLSTSTPIERAVPSITLIAWSTSRAFRSTSFVSAIERTCARVRRPTLFRFGSGEPFSSRSASLIRTAAGGVFVMKSKLRSSKT